ncbi:MAG: sugar phosphate isomerase/epimerase [Acidobacteriaceae bacterium]
MANISRRHFIGTTAAVGALTLPNRWAWANPLGLPLGIQLYSVRQQMAEDLDAALAAIKAAGYTEVEAAALPKKSAAEIRAALDKVGLRCVSAHHPFPELLSRFDEILDYDKQLGVQFLICSSPAARAAGAPAAPGSRRVLSLDDWHYNAEQFNSFGEKTASKGIRFGYHNHMPEFAATDGKVPYLELLRLTDPKKVTFELDCGWAVMASANPIEIMKSHPHRISMLHVKDFKMSGNPTPGAHEGKVTELGQGSIDYRPIFAEAKRTQHIEHAFVEQEAFDMPWQQSLKLDAEYMRSLNV